MAEIEIVYVDGGYCECEGGDYCFQCHTAAAEDLGCTMFNKGKHGDCIHAMFKYKYKGMSIKNYELYEEDNDPYNPHLNCMMLKTKNGLYPCEKVVLNGKVVYGEHFEKSEDEGEKRCHITKNPKSAP